jgi:hypothetical protein
MAVVIRAKLRTLPGEEEVDVIVGKLVVVDVNEKTRLLLVVAAFGPLALLLSDLGASALRSAARVHDRSTVCRAPCLLRWHAHVILYVRVCSYVISKCHVCCVA